MITMAASRISAPLFVSKELPHYHRLRLRLLRRLCHCISSAVNVSNVVKNREAFANRMAMAGLEPHHRIAVGVSGGPDSMALCVLSAQWKINGLGDSRDGDGFIDGILGIVVDHRLRSESKDEADMVSRRVSEMGIKCEISQCVWVDGRPKQGHLQESAHDMRYQHFQKVCVQNQISVLLIAHHADDQAELFVLRLSRNSGVLGLAGMPFVSQIFSAYTHSCDSRNHGILLVRPLLDFSKEDMYKICQGGDQKWVEDPTNQSLLYARNRIRKSLRDYSSCRFNSELQAVLSACQQTRSYVDHACSNLINKAVTIMDLGYAIIDLEILNSLKSEDIVVSRFIALILQFISQRNGPVRGSTLKLVLGYMLTFPCKTSLTAAGCYLCPAPSSRGTKALVCYSINHPVPRVMESLSAEQQHRASNEIEHIVLRSKLCLENSVPDAAEVHFLETNSGSILSEAERLRLISDSTRGKVFLLQSEEVEWFRFKPEKPLPPESEQKERVESIRTYCEELHSGETRSFMNRFFVTWKLNKEVSTGDCGSCEVSDNMLYIRHIAECDWLYLASLLQRPTSDHARFSAQKALSILKPIPVAARRGLPVFIDAQGLLLGIPSIGFQRCPQFDASAVFRPRVPLGGGHIYYSYTHCSYQSSS